MNLREEGTPGLLRGRPDGIGKPRPALLGPVPAPAHDRTLGHPRDEGVHAVLGAGCERLLVVSALSERLDESDARARQLLLNGGEPAAADLRLADDVDFDRHPPPVPVHDVDPIAHARAPYDGGVVGLGPGEDDLLGIGEVRIDVDR